MEPPLGGRRTDEGPTHGDPGRDRGQADQPKGSIEQLIGDYYAACMDEPLGDQRGLDPVKPLLAQIDAMPAAADLQQHDHSPAAAVSRSRSTFGGTPDPHNPTQTIADISAGGLGMPDRDYYFKTEQRFKEARDNTGPRDEAVQARRATPTPMRPEGRRHR